MLKLEIKKLKELNYSNSNDYLELSNFTENIYFIIKIIRKKDLN